MSNSEKIGGRTGPYQFTPEEANARPLIALNIGLQSLYKNYLQNPTVLKEELILTKERKIQGMIVTGFDEQLSSIASRIQTISKISLGELRVKAHNLISGPGISLWTITPNGSREGLSVRTYQPSSNLEILAIQSIMVEEDKTRRGYQFSLYRLALVADKQEKTVTGHLALEDSSTTISAISLEYFAYSSKGFDLMTGSVQSLYQTLWTRAEREKNIFFPPLPH